jgi:undecaprenyl-diphosphatase
MAGTKGGKRAAETLARADGDVDEAVAPYRDSPLVKALSAGSDLGDQPQLRLVSGGLLAAGLLRSDGRMTRAGLRMLVAHELTTFAKNVVKKRIDRTRPRSAQSVDRRKIKPGSSRQKEETSFPSGHSAGAIAVARAFTREYPEHSTPALAAAGLVAVAQVPRCAHYISDVAAGLALGVATEAASNVAWEAVEAKLP